MPGRCPGLCQVRLYSSDLFSLHDWCSHLLTEESLAEQVQLMKDNVCPQLGVDGCEGILDMWYADMATCIFNHFIIEGDACALAGKF